MLLGRSSSLLVGLRETDIEKRRKNCAERLAEDTKKTATMANNDEELNSFMDTLSETFEQIPCFSNYAYVHNQD